MKRILATILALAGAAFAQVPSGGPSVTMVSAHTPTLAPGKKAPATLVFRVNDGFHINSNTPNSELLIPTALKLEPPTDVMIAGVKYPAGELLKFPFMEEKLSVYSGEFSVKPTVLAAQSLRPGTYRIRGSLKFQACNDRQCFPPKTTPIHFDIKVGKSGSAPSSKARRNPGQSPHIKR